jgi:hypothetical protein
MNLTCSTKERGDKFIYYFNKKRLKKKVLKWETVMGTGITRFHV